MMVKPFMNLQSSTNTLKKNIESIPMMPEEPIERAKPEFGWTIAQINTLHSQENCL